MYSNVLKEILNLEVTYDPNNGYRAADGTWWEIIPESESEYELASCREDAIEYFKEEIKYSDFEDLSDFVDWNKFAIETYYTLENFGWEKYEVDGIFYYIKQS